LYHLASSLVHQSRELWTSQSAQTLKPGQLSPM